MSRIRASRLMLRLLLLASLLSILTVLSLKQSDVKARTVRTCGVICCENQRACIEACNARAGTPGFNLAGCHSKCRMNCRTCVEVECNVALGAYCPFPDYTNCPAQ
jgi:hypothetical protein